MESTLSDDWSADDTEKWGAKFLGPCENMVFSINQGFNVRISKVGEDNLSVKDVRIRAGKEECTNWWFWRNECKILDQEYFSCGSFMLGFVANGQEKVRRLQQTNNCRTLVWKNLVFRCDGISRVGVGESVCDP